MLKLKYYGHAAFALENEEAVLLFDPFFTGNPSAKVDWQEISCDYILVSHGHGDHVGDAGAIAEKNKALVVGIPELLEIIKPAKAHGMNIGGKVKFPFGNVYMTQAIHSSGLSGGIACGFVVEIGGKTIYYAGDTALFSDMKLIGGKFALDYAVLPIGDNYTMGIEEAAEAVKLLQAKNVIPVHYNTWPIIKQNPEQFKYLVEENTNSKVHILKASEELTL